MSFYIYQCFIPIKSCIFALIYRIPLSDTEMDYLRAKSSDSRVNFNYIIELKNSECHSGASQVNF